MSEPPKMDAHIVVKVILRIAKNHLTTQQMYKIKYKCIK